MCRFKHTELKNLNLQKKVSIHPMCRFKKKVLLMETALTGFNTSYVSVQEPKKSYELEEVECFNTSYVSVQVWHKL